MHRPHNVRQQLFWRGSRRNVTRISRLIMWYRGSHFVAHNPYHSPYEYSELLTHTLRQLAQKFLTCTKAIKTSEIPDLVLFILYIYINIYTSSMIKTYPDGLRGDNISALPPIAGSHSTQGIVLTAANSTFLYEHTDRRLNLNFGLSRMFT